MEGNRRFINRLTTTVFFLLLASVGKCSIAFFYTLEFELGDPLELGIQIRQTLMDKYGWNWYFNNMVVSPIQYKVQFSNLRRVEDGPKDPECGLWLTVMDDSNDTEKIGYIKESIDLMANNNDSIIFSFPIDGFTPHIDFKKLGSDTMYRDSIFLGYLSTSLDEALYDVFYKGKYTKCFRSRGHDFKNLIFESYGIISSDQMFTDLWNKSVVEDYISECKSLRIRPLLNGNDFGNATEEEIKLLGKYVMVHDKRILNKPVPINIYKMDFIYDPEKCDFTTTIYPGNEYTNLTLPDYSDDISLKDFTTNWKCQILTSMRARD